MPKVFINDREIDVPDGLNMIQAAKLAGIEIPHFCYHPGLGVDGNCRLCTIEIDGVPKPQIACNTFAREGLKIRTDTERVREIRRAVLEFFFLNHPLDCPICDQSGECLLQDFYMRYGKYESRLDLPKVHKRKAVQIGPRVTLDAERCVLCRRCVRFCDHVTGTGEIRVVNRGNRSEITVLPDKPLENAYSLNTVDICPVGALTSTDFRFKCRVWFLSSTRSICTGCSRGCNVFLDSSEGIAYRLRPRENQAVNKWWMCDDGRMTYRSLNDDRCEVPLVDRKETDHDFAVAAIAERLRTAAGEVTLLLSADMSNESLHAARAFGERILGLPVSRIVAGSVKPPAIEDEILRRADPHPNRRGCDIMGIWKEDLRAALGSGGKVLLVIQNDLVDHDPAAAQILRLYESVICLSTNLGRTTEMAGIVHPVTPHSECDGTFTNFEGRVQRFRRGTPARGDAMTVAEVLARVASAMGKRGFGWVNLNQIWREMAESIPAFAGLSPEAIGDQGIEAGSPGVERSEPKR
jgi:NADH-quinone oxidoreductase subunit G